MKNILSVLIIFLLLLCACSSGQEDDVVASFKGGVLTAKDLDAHYQKLKKQPMFMNKPESLTPEFVFEHALNMEMIIARGFDRKLQLDPRIRAEIHGYISELFLKIMQDDLVPAIDKSQFSDDELLAFYNEHQDSYTTPPLLRIRMIKTAAEAAAEEALARLNNGEIDFETAARTYSEDGRTRDSGGFIGTRSLRKFQPSWRAVIGSLEPDQVSGPHRIDDAWYLFELVKKTEAVVHSFDEKKQYVKNDLLYAKYKEEWQGVYDRLKERFDVEINQKMLDAFIAQRKAS